MPGHFLRPHSATRTAHSWSRFAGDLATPRQVVVLHDETLWRTATAHSWSSWLGGVVDSGVLRTPVSELSLEEVRAVDVGDAASPSRVPTFAEAL